MKIMRNLMILGVFILIAVSGFSQTNEDGHRILKENGIESKNDVDSKAIAHGRCRTIFNTPNGVYITTMEWIGNTKRFRPVIYLYVDYDTNFYNGKLSKIESLEGFAAFEYSEKLNMLLIAKGISSIEDDVRNPLFDISIYTYDLTTNTKIFQIKYNISLSTKNKFTPKFSSNLDSIEGVGQTIKLK
jgi:hypothetical protein